MKTTYKPDTPVTLPAGIEAEARRRYEELADLLPAMKQALEGFDLFRARVLEILEEHPDYGTIEWDFGTAVEGTDYWKAERLFMDYEAFLNMVRW